MRLRILYVSCSREIYSAQITRYGINLLPLVSVHWVTEITHVDEPHNFVDEQRFGPYRLWPHQYFTEVPGGVEMTDEVNYSIPLGFLGQLANWLFVERMVNAIFDHRFTMLVAYFGDDKTKTRKSA